MIFRAGIPLHTMLVYYGKMNQALLPEKTKRYEDLLRKALNAFEVAVQEDSHMRRVAEDYSKMADAYYEDGLRFLEDKDLVNALVCFSYGHAWLDAGVRLGVFRANDENLFTI